MNNSIYRLESDPENYLWLTLSDETDSDKLEAINEAKSIASIWNPLPVEPIIEDENDKKKLLSDFPTFWAHPIMSKQAIVALRDFLNENAELLPVKGEPYYIVNITSLLDVLDEDKSTLKRFTSSDGIMKITKYWFNEADLNNTSIFRLPQFRRVEVFVNHEFRKRVELSGLTGFVFEKVWPHHEGENA